MSRRCGALAWTLAAGMGLAGCGGGAGVVGAPDGTERQAKARVEALLRAHGCVHCHTMDGLHMAHGRVGPPLTQWPQRVLIAGRHPNTAENLTRFLLDPRGLSGGGAMPRTVTREDDARAIAAWLLGLPLAPPPLSEKH